MHLQDLWPSPLAENAFPSQEIQLWSVSLATVVAHLQDVQPHLSTTEVERAQRYHFAADRARFIVGRGLLRMIVGHYLGIKPAEVGFCYNTYGKPALALEDGERGLQFNLSHAGDRLLYAFAWQRAVGVDVERIRANIEYEVIAVRFFSPQERAALAAVPAKLRLAAFFDGWTRKEAYLKAQGAGLSLPLDSFDVTITPGEPAALIATRPNAAEAGRWSMQALDVGDEYRAALVAEGQDWTVTWV
jgi:4'-phosphopantetheinyl transferase